MVRALPSLCLSLMLALPAGARAGHMEELSVRRAELDRVAARIAELKARPEIGAGAELERLLVRSQELAQEIERLGREGRPAAPALAPAEDPRELKEQADLLRDEQDRLKKSLDAVDQRLRDAKRQRRLEARMKELGDEGALFDEQGGMRIAHPTVGNPNSLSAMGAKKSVSTSTSDPATTSQPAPGTAATGGPGGGGGTGGSTPASSPQSSPDTASPSPNFAMQGPEGGVQGSEAMVRSATLRPDWRQGIAAAGPEDDDSPKTLKAKRAEIEAALRSLGGRIDALDAKAKALEQAR